METDRHKMERGFNFMPSFYSAAKKLKKAADQAAFYNAICEYMLDGVIPTFPEDSIAASLWELVYPVLRESKQRSKAGTAGRQKHNKPKSKTQQTEIKNTTKANQTEDVPPHFPSLRIKEKEKEKEKEKPDRSALMPELPVFCPRCHKPPIRNGDRAVCPECNLFLFPDGSIDPIAAAAKEATCI